MSDRPSRGVIPRYQERIALRGADPVLGRVPNYDSGGIGDGFRALAAATQSILQQHDERKFREQSAWAEAEVGNTTRWASEALATLDTTPPDKFDETKRAIDTEWSTRRSKLLAGSTDERVKHFVTINLDDARGRFDEKLRAYEAKAITDRNVTGYQTGIAGRATEVRNDPGTFLPNLAAAIESADRITLSQDARIAAKRYAREQLLSAGVDGYLATRPQWFAAELANAESTDVIVRELDPEARAKALAAAQKAATEQVVGGRVSAVMAAYGRGVSLGNEALTTATQGLSEPDALEVRARVRAQVNLLSDERQRQFGAEIAGIENAISAGTATSSTADRIQSLYERSALTPAQYGSLRGRLTAMQTERAERLRDAEDVAGALRAGLPLDPSNAKHRKAVDNAFAAETAGTKPGDERFAYAALAIARQTRVVPAQAAGWMRQAARSPSPVLTAQAARLYGAIARTAPEAVDGLDTDTRALLGTINAMTEAGTAPEEAARTARQITVDAAPELLERRRTEWGTLAKDSDQALAALVDRDFDPGWFQSAPETTATLAADFNAQAGRYYQRTGDPVLARDLAWRDLKRIYGPSEVNGVPMLLPFPPERFGVPPAEVRADIAKALSMHPQADGSTIDDMMVVPDALTLRAVSDALTGAPVTPSYKLVTKTGDVAVDADGMPLRYQLPDSGELRTRIESARAAEAKAKVDAARVARDRRAAQRRTLEESAAAGDADAERLLGSL